MVGSPLLRLALVFVALVLLAIPAFRLTGRQAPPVPEATEKADSDMQNVTVEFSSPLVPAEITLEALGATLATLTPDVSPVTMALPMPLPAEGLDLVVKATWSGSAGTNALRVQARSGREVLADSTLWGGTHIEDVVTLTGTAKP